MSKTFSKSYVSTLPLPTVLDYLELANSRHKYSPVPLKTMDLFKNLSTEQTLSYLSSLKFPQQAWWEKLFTNKPTLSNHQIYSVLRSILDKALANTTHKFSHLSTLLDNIDQIYLGKTSLEQLAPLYKAWQSNELNTYPTLPPLTSNTQRLSELEPPFSVIPFFLQATDPSDPTPLHQRSYTLVINLITGFYQQNLKLSQDEIDKLVTIPLNGLLNSSLIPNLFPPNRAEFYKAHQVLKDRSNARNNK